MARWVCPACLTVLVLAAFSPSFATATASAGRPAMKRSCGSLERTPITAYNLGCGRARSIWHRASASGLPRGWAGANLDLGGGEALVFPKHFEAQVLAALGKRHGVNRDRLGRARLIFAYVPYGE